MEKINKLKNPMVARGLAVCNCMCSFMTIILLCAGVIIPRNFTFDQLRQGHSEMNLDNGHVYKSYTSAARTLGLQSPLSGRMNCDDFYQRYVANDTFKFCRGVNKLGANSINRFPNDQGFITESTKSMSPICDADRPDESYVGPRGTNSMPVWFDDPLDWALGTAYYREKQPERDAMYSSCMNNKYKPYAVLVWGVLYFIAITVASIVFAFKPRQEKSMILFVAIVLLLVTLLQIRIENTDQVSARLRFRNCHKDQLAKEDYYGKVPPSKSLVQDRHNGKCVFTSTNAQYATCTKDMSLLDPQKLKYDCKGRTAACTEKVLRTDKNGVDKIVSKAPKDWFGKHNNALNKTIKWDEQAGDDPENPTYRWCIECTAGSEDSSNAWVLPAQPPSVSAPFVSGDPNCPTPDGGLCFTSKGYPELLQGPSPGTGYSGSCTVNIQQEGKLKVEKFDVSEDTMTYRVAAETDAQTGNILVNAIEEEFKGKSGPNNLHVKAGSRLTFAHGADTVHGFKICIVPQSLVPSPIDTQPSTTVMSFGRGNQEGGEAPDVWLAPTGAQCAWSYTNLDGEELLGLPTDEAAHQLFPPLEKQAAQTCINKNAVGLGSFKMNDKKEMYKFKETETELDSYSQFLVEYGTSEFCFTPDAQSLFSSRRPATLGRQMYPNCVNDNYEHKCYVKRKTSASSTVKDQNGIDVPVGGDGAGNNTCYVTTAEETDCVCKCTDIDKAIGWCTTTNPDDEATSIYEMAVDHPLYYICKDKNVCEEKDEINQECDWLGDATLAAPPQQEARTFFTLENAMCANRDTHSSTDVDYCTSKSQLGSKYFFGGDCSSGMEDATITSQEDEEALAKNLWENDNQGIGNQNTFWIGLEAKIYKNSSSDETGNTGAYAYSSTKHWNPTNEDAWVRSDGISSGVTGKRKSAPSYLPKDYDTVVNQRDFSKNDTSKCTAGEPYPDSLEVANGKASSCDNLNPEQWTCAAGWAPVKRPGNGNGYTCFEGGTIDIWISEADYFPFHPDPAPSVWSWDLHVPPPAAANCGSSCTLAVMASLGPIRVNGQLPPNARLKDYKTTGKLSFGYARKSSSAQTLCRQRSIYSDNCVVNTELECINKYTECNDEQEAAWKIKAEKAKYQYAFPSTVTAAGTNPNAGICFTSFDGKLVDPVALTYYQATNCLITGLVFGYFVLLFTSLLACQMALSAGSPSPNNGTRPTSSTNNPLSQAPRSETELSNVVSVPMPVLPPRSNEEAPFKKKNKSLKSKRKSKTGKMAVGGPPPPLVSGTKPPGAKPPPMAKPPPVTKPPSMAPALAPLKPGWAEFVHEESGRKYYYNAQTKENVWDRTMAS